MAGPEIRESVTVAGRAERARIARVLRRDGPGGLIGEYAQVACGDTVSGTRK